MFLKRFVIFLFMVCSLITKGQSVINDCGSRLSLSAEKKINDKFSLIGKIQFRQAENFRLLNRIYFRLGLNYSLNEHFTFNVTGNYMLTRGGFWEMEKAYRYSAAITYKTKLTDRLTLSNKLMYQNTSDYLMSSEYVKQKNSGVVRDKITLKYKLNRRGSVYFSEELLWQVAGKKERYFGRNRIYIGYSYKLNQKLTLEPYFILERTHNKSGGPQNRNFYYCLDLGYSF